MYSILNRIREVINTTGLSDTQFAKSCGIPQATFSNMYQRQSEPKAELLQKITEIYKVNAHWLLTGEGDMFLSSLKNLEVLSQSIDSTIQKRDETLLQQNRIPILSQKVSCGPGQSWESEQNIVEYIDVKSLSPMLTAKNVYGFRVVGTSMIGAGIRNGDIVLFNASTDYMPTDGIYVFGLDGDTYCKRLEFDRLANRIKIYSVRVADLEKAELLKTLDSTDEEFAERFKMFGKVFSWIHVANDEGM